MRRGCDIAVQELTQRCPQAAEILVANDDVEERVHQMQQKQTSAIKINKNDINGWLAANDELTKADKEQTERRETKAESRKQQHKTRNY